VRPHSWAYRQTGSRHSPLSTTSSTGEASQLGILADRQQTLTALYYLIYRSGL
jgi:hypothetical protein